MDLDWQSSLIVIGLAIIALLLFTFMWGRFAPSNYNDSTPSYSPVIYLKTDDIPEPPRVAENISISPMSSPSNIPITPIESVNPDESLTPIQSVRLSKLVKPITPAKPARRKIIRPTRPKRPKITGEIVPLYSKKRRSRGENMCARSLEELFGVPFPSERPMWAMGKKGKPLEYDCINHQYKLALEYHGQQHYEPGHFRMDDDDYADQNERDRMKFQYAIDNGYYLITVPYTVPIEEIKDYIISYLPGNRKKRIDEDATL